MLARLQQLMVLALLLHAVYWAHGAAAGTIVPGYAWIGAMLPLALYAVVLGLEFVCMRVINARGHAPPATMVQVCRAWWGELCSGLLVFGWRQPFRSHRWPDRLDERARGQRGVLLVHGFVCNRGIWNSWLARLGALQVPFVAVNLEPVFGHIDDYLPGLDAGIRRLHEVTGMAPVVVAHSMGGLALRRWWSKAGNSERIHHAITLGTPHHGTWLAHFALSANGRQMRMDSAWLSDVAASESAAQHRRLTCFYGHCDNIVFPAVTATLPGANNRHLPGVAHVHMVESSEPYKELLRRLSD